MPIAVLMLLAVSSVSLAETKTASFFSVWEGRGSYHPIEGNRMLFAGSIEGSVYLETAEGPVESGYVSCVGDFELEIETAKQAGEGVCQLTSGSGAILMTSWSCSGVHMVGCSGQMDITRGRGPFASASGGGAFTIRGALRDAARTAAGPGAEAELRGIIFWTDFTIEVPE